jgi:hypothetical protein
LAKELNAENVPPPTKHQHGWAPSCIREMLHRELYRGVVTWNKTQAVHRNGTQISRNRPKDEWLHIEIPELRIVDEVLWQKVEARLEQTRGYYMRTFGNGRFLGRPSGADMRSEYLLSGIAQCALCGGSMICQKRHPKQGRNVYACAYHHDRDKCPNDLRIRQDLMDATVLRAVSERLDRHIISEAIERALPEIQSKHAMLPDQRHALERQLASVEARLAHLVDAIATGKATEAVYAALQKEESIKKALQAQLSGLQQIAQLASVDTRRRTIDQLLDRVNDLPALLGRHVPQTRQLLRRLIDDTIVDGKRRPGRIVCTPFDNATGRGYELRATASYARLLGSGLVVNNGGGGQAIKPSLASLLYFKIQGIAIAA